MHATGKHLLLVSTWSSLCILYLLACQVIVTVGDSGLCCVPCYIHVTSVKGCEPPSVVDSKLPSQPCFTEQSRVNSKHLKAKSFTA